MSGTVEHLPPVVPAPVAPADGDLGDVRHHPMRQVTERVLHEPAWWDPSQARQVASFFDALAADWDARHRGNRLEPLEDALVRGGVPDGGRWVEVGSGTGLVTARLAELAGSVLAVDVAWEMLRRAPAGPGHRVLADGACLPLPDGAAHVVALVNAFLFPAEVARVLQPGGAVLWVNTRGPGTPIHLPADRIVEALPGAWSAVASSAGEGTWAVLRRAGGTP